PSPYLANSQGLSVLSRLPIWKFLDVAAVTAPCPTCKFTGLPSPSKTDALVKVSYSISLNSALSFLYPVVLTFERLLDITSTLNCCAFIPELAVQSALIIGLHPPVILLFLPHLLLLPTLHLV